MVYFNTIKRAFKNKTNKLSTEAATRKIQNEAEELIEELVKESESLAEHADRKTIKEEDVERVLERSN